MPTIAVGSSTDPASCGVDGSIVLNFTNVPDGTYTIDYDLGSFTGVVISSGTATISAPAGVYDNLSITVTGCTSTDDPDVTLTAPNLPTIAVGSSTDPASCGVDGSIVLNFTNVPDGTYTINYDLGSFTGVVISSGTATILGSEERHVR